MFHIDSAMAPTRIIHLCLITLPLTFLTSRATSQLMTANVSMESHEEAKLFKAELNNLSRHRNHFLSALVTGQELALQGKFAESNEYLERAFQALGDKEHRITPKERFGFEYEMYMLLYLKALNYCSRGEREEALVECNRMKDWLSRCEGRTGNQFKDEPLPHVLLGLIYESEGYYNDAFIAYRAAYQSYNKNYVGFFGSADVRALQYALIDTGQLAGLSDEATRLANEFGLEQPAVVSTSGHLILICHIGVGPRQEEQTEQADYQEHPAAVNAELVDSDSGHEFTFGTAFQMRFLKGTDWWTSLPRGIFFSRVSLHPGANKFMITWSDDKCQKLGKSIDVTANGTNDIRVFSTFEPYESTQVQVYDYGFEREQWRPVGAQNEMLKIEPWQSPPAHPDLTEVEWHTWSPSPPVEKPGPNTWHSPVSSHRPRNYWSPVSMAVGAVKLSHEK